MQADQLRRKQEMASDASDAMSQPSMDLDDIMQGRMMQDIIAEQDAEQRKYDIEMAMQARETGTISGKFDGETDSVASMMLDQVIKARRADPKVMKTGGTKMLEDNSSMGASSFAGTKKGDKKGEENDAHRLEQLARL